jgi:small-conductance mechanosensitive channel
MRWWLSIAAAALLLWAAAAPPAARAQAQPAAEPPPAVSELLGLLDDPEVRAWLAARRAAAPAHEPAGILPTGSDHGQMIVASSIEMMRGQLDELVDAIPRIPDELARAGEMQMVEIEQRGVLTALLLLGVFVATGYGAVWVFWQATAGARRWILDVPLATVSDRLKAVGARFAFGTGWILSFAAGSLGAFLLFDWPPLLSETVAAFLVVFVLGRWGFVLGRFFLAPGAPRFRIVPMETDAAWFWHRRMGVLFTYVGFAWATLWVLSALGIAPDVRRVFAVAFGFGLLLMAVEAVWRRPVPDREPATLRRHRSRAWMLSAFFVLLWGLQLAGARELFATLAVLAGLPALVGVQQRAVAHILRPAGAADAEAALPGVSTVLLERGLRAVLVVAGAVIVARAWSVDLDMITAAETPMARLVRGAFDAVVIVLVADFAWHAAKAVIDGRIARAASGPGDGEEARKRARVRTLLPILRNVLAVVLGTMTVLMALSALGIDIAPLVAGAGVVGIAVGFGAQTLVRDVMSGIFFLLDDAFRVGEYIQSGSYKGTVESFSLRSVKLRHHRGPLYTVPFGELGAIQNLSRDWVIDKFTIGVRYDTDLEKARKLIKQIGRQLAEDPEHSPHIIEGLKMQGVEQFGDFAIQIRLKMMTKPGEQFVLRRKAYGMIKKAFDENGIRFAFPTVQVAGGDGGDGVAAAARQAVEMVSPPSGAPAPAQ